MNKKSLLIPVYKNVGESPLDVIKRLKERCPEMEGKKMAYAGRLDPIAEGVVLIVRGEELKRFDDYLGLDKEYEAEILFGFSSDTYDILGIPQKKSVPKKEEVEGVLKKFKGSFRFSLPPFSGYKIKKKPLFWWALQGKLDEVSVPEKTVRIYSISISDVELKNSSQLKEEIITKIDKVDGDFRQEEIKKKWKSLLKKKEDYLVVKVKISCSSGCYIRAIADQAGSLLKSGGLLLHLKRIRVGDYKKTLDL